MFKKRRAKERCAKHLGILAKDFVHASIRIEITEAQWQGWLATATSDGLIEWLDGTWGQAPADVTAEVVARLQELTTHG